MRCDIARGREGGEIGMVSRKSLDRTHHMSDGELLPKKNTSCKL